MVFTSALEATGVLNRQPPLVWWLLYVRVGIALLLLALALWSLGVDCVEGECWHFATRFHNWVLCLAVVKFSLSAALTQSVFSSLKWSFGAPENLPHALSESPKLAAAYFVVLRMHSAIVPLSLLCFVSYSLFRATEVLRSSELTAAICLLLCVALEFAVTTVRLRYRFVVYPMAVALAYVMAALLFSATGGVVQGEHGFNKKMIWNRKKDVDDAVVTSMLGFVLIVIVFLAAANWKEKQLAAFLEAALFKTGSQRRVEGLHADTLKAIANATKTPLARVIPEDELECGEGDSGEIRSDTIEAPVIDRTQTKGKRTRDSTVAMGIVLTDTGKIVAQGIKQQKTADEWVTVSTVEMTHHFTPADFA